MRPSRFLVVIFVSFVTALVTATSIRAQTVTTLYSFSNKAGYNPQYVMLTQGRDGALYGTAQNGGTQNCGTVFRQRTNGTNITLHEFNCTDGANPQASLTLAGDGNFYGAATLGGLYGFGVLFKITSAGSFTVLYNFTGGSDGGEPISPPIEGFDGNLYGTTSTQSVPEAVYKYVPSSGVLSTIYTAQRSTGNNFFSSPLQAADGNLYVTTNAGGSSGCGSILKLTVGGTLLSSRSFPCQPGGAFPLGPVIQAIDGNIYGTTALGGKYGMGTVFRIAPVGAIKTLYNFGTVNADASNIEAGLTQGTDGNFYGTSIAGGISASGVLFQLTPAGVYSKIYDFTGPQGFDGPREAPTQHTNGSFYGVTPYGGANSAGQVYQLSEALGPFIALVRTQGHVGANAQILGQGLTGTTTVTFNGVPATGYKVVNDTYMTAVVPSGATTGKVVVTTPGGALTSNVNFRIIN